MGQTLKTKELVKLGKLISKAFEEKYGYKSPDTIMRMCNGVNVHVNAYRVKDIDLVDGTIQEFIGRGL